MDIDPRWRDAASLAACPVSTLLAERDIPVTISCSHEHTAWPGTVSISRTTLTAVVADVMASLRRSGPARFAVVNGHGGNDVLSNIVQEGIVDGAVMTLFPPRDDWTAARTAGGEDRHRTDDDARAPFPVQCWTCGQQRRTARVHLAPATG